MSMLTVDRVTDMFVQEGVEYAGVTGGEPTLHPEFAHIVTLALSKGLAVHVKSNGIWDQDVLKSAIQWRSERSRYLIGMLPPEQYRRSEWDKLLITLDSLPADRITLGLTISSPDFEYDYIMNLVQKYGIKQFRWALAHPSSNSGTGNSYVTIDDYSGYASRIVQMAETLSSYGATVVGDHSSIRCMWTPNQWNRLEQIGARQITTCEPTVDILPDGAAAYCLPLAGFYTLDLLEMNNLSVVVAYFDRLSQELRAKRLPFKECEDCEFYPDICHGGCLAHRFRIDDSPRNVSWNCEANGSETLRLRQNLVLQEIVEKGELAYQLYNFESNNVEFRLTTDSSCLLQEFNGTNKISDIEKLYSDHKFNKAQLRKALNRFLLTCWSFRLLEKV